MNYPIAQSKWQKEEYLALFDVLSSDRYTCGDRVAEFERDFCKRFGFKHAVMTNSGSSANLLIVSSLFYAGLLKRDSTIIVPAIAWSTSYSPFIQFGMKLRVVDIDEDTLGYDIESLMKTDASDASAILVVNMLGNCNEYSKILDYAEKNNLVVIGDNCEAMGSLYDGEPVGSMEWISSFSMFYSHHICTVEGGVVVTGDDNLYDIMKSLRAHGWSRGIRKPQSSRDLYQFLYPGYNVRPTEIAAALGITQIKRFDEILDGYQRNALFFKSIIGKIDGIKIQKEIGRSSWMGFYIFVEHLPENLMFADFCRMLESVGIETRPIMCCLHNQPMCQFAEIETLRPLVNADRVYERGFYVGNSCSDLRKEIISLEARLRSFL